jgi:hypothetical protein
MRSILILHPHPSFFLLNLLGLFLSHHVDAHPTVHSGQTESPVDSILAERGAKHVNVNLLRYFSEPDTLDGKAKDLLPRGMALAMEWAVQGTLVPHIGRTIGSSVEAINAGLQSLKEGGRTLGKVAVIVDRDLPEGT